MQVAKDKEADTLVKESLDQFKKLSVAELRTKTGIQAVKGFARWALTNGILANDPLVMIKKPNSESTGG